MNNEGGGLVQKNRKFVNLSNTSKIIIHVLGIHVFYLIHQKS
jgi:hypothetical protein